MPFDHFARGFNNSWWQRSIGRVGEDIFNGAKYFQLVSREKEIGRAEVVGKILSDSYMGIDYKLDAYEITFIEIQEDFRCLGFGNRFINLMEDYYSGKVLFAFSEGADGFWSRIGWRHYPRKDSEGWPYCRPLFISQEINPMIKSY